MILQQDNPKKILVLGAAGMLGSAVFRYFYNDLGFETSGTVRSPSNLLHFSEAQRSNLICNVDIQSQGELISLFSEIRPEVVINCVGVIKQLSAAKDHVTSIGINAYFPHRLAQLCRLVDARLIHLSTDCVFSGKKGLYSEEDFADADDLYGRSKLLGEVDYPNAITLRTSIIGHELASARSLIDWFLSQEGSIKGYKKAVFSGLPTVEIARVIRDFVLPNRDLRGLYHLSAAPINKYDLLCRVASVYGKHIRIAPDNSVNIDRSLNSDRFQTATGFNPPNWDTLIARMHETYHENEISNV